VPNLGSKFYPKFAEKSSHSWKVECGLLLDCGFLRLLRFAVEHRHQFAECVATRLFVVRPCPATSSVLAVQNPQKTGHLTFRPHMCRSRTFGKHRNASAGADADGQVGMTRGCGAAFRTCGETTRVRTPPISRFSGISRHCGRYLAGGPAHCVSTHRASQTHPSSRNRTSLASKITWRLHMLAESGQSQRARERAHGLAEDAQPPAVVTAHSPATHAAVNPDQTHQLEGSPAAKGRYRPPIGV
jgi:hypothetical protein